VIAPKHCALAAAGGFVLSALIGLVSGNFGSRMFVRALVCGLVVGVVCLGVYVVLIVVLGVGAEAGTPGSTVDISVDDESFFGSDEDATFNTGNLGDGPGQSSQFDDVRAAINVAPSPAAEPGNQAGGDASVGSGRGFAHERPAFADEPVVVADKPAEADQPVFTAAPLAAKGQRKAVDLGNLDNMDPAAAAKAIQSMLRLEK
jgi:hypothetical protein